MLWPAASRAAANSRSVTVNARLAGLGVHIGARDRVRLEALGRDRLAGDLVDPVGAHVEALQRGFDLRELVLELLEDRHVLLALEQLRALVGRVLGKVRQVADLIGLLCVEPFAAEVLDQPVHPFAVGLEAVAGGGFVEVLRHGAKGIHAPGALTEVATRAQQALVVREELCEQIETRPGPHRFEHALRVERADRRERRDLVRRLHRVVGDHRHWRQAGIHVPVQVPDHAECLDGPGPTRRGARRHLLGDVDDLRLRVGIVGQPPLDPNAADPHRREREAAVGELLDADDTRDVPTEKRVSPPPTSLPRSISTTPNSPSPRMTRWVIKR